MGNSFSYRAVCSPRRGEVMFDLTKLNATLSFEAGNAKGAFFLPFNLGHQTVPVGDLLALARQDVPVMARVIVGVERKKRLEGADSLGPKNVERLAEGISQPLMIKDSEWRICTRVDTDIGMIVVETRIVADVMGVTKLEMTPGGWLTRAGANIVGRAEGNVELYVRVRFEMQCDRFMGWFQTLTWTGMIVLPVIAIRAARRFLIESAHNAAGHHHRGRRALR
eukprot:TRINITY_DN2704_c0_g1_i1.p1 TRINITY_DN2704_c0_g1~~TRINITY_DN2704_c0_g1_i1.p1  ORF type:complete len:223 (-),score=24.54 TRINITY_DN2704_c0_g1_i1:134-802(-)